MILTHVALIGQLNGGGPATPPAANEIFNRARQTVRRIAYPHFLDYDITLRVTENGVEKSNRYHGTYDADRDTVHVDAVSDEERQHPPAGNGISFHLNPKRQGRALYDWRVGAPDEAVDLLGVPEVAPTYWYGLAATAEGAETTEQRVAEVRRQFNDPMPDATAEELARNGTYREVASVVSVHRDYEVELAEVSAYEGTPAYHLVLQALDHPEVHRLRQMWVARDSYEVLAVVVARNFDTQDGPWAITFGSCGQARCIAREEALGETTNGRHRYEHASITFSNVAAADHGDDLALHLFRSKGAVLHEPDTGGSHH